MEVNKLFLTIAIFILVALLAFLFVLPKYHASQELDATLMKKHAEYEGKFIYFSKIAELIKNVEANQDALEKVNIAIPQDFSYASVVYFLQKKGNESGLLVKSVTFAPMAVVTVGVSEQAPMQSVTFTINVSGNYQGLKNLISSLQSSARLFEIKSITFNSLGSSSGGAGALVQSSLYNFELVIKTNTY